MKSFFQLKSQKFENLYKLNAKHISKISWNKIDLQASVAACLELSNYNFDPNEADEETTILLDIIATEKLDLVEFLVKKGADANFYHKEGGYPLENAARLASDDIFNYLEPLTNLKTKYQIFITSTVNNEHEILQRLIASSINVDSPKEYGNGRTPLIIAVQEGNEKMVKIFLEAGANPNLKDEDSGTTPLISAVKRQYIYMTRLLLKNGADVNICDKYGDTPLEIAMKLHNEKKLRNKNKLRTQRIIDLLIQGG